MMGYSKRDNTYFLKAKDDPTDAIDLEIGDSKQQEFIPQIKVMRWDNETNVSIRLDTGGDVGLESIRDGAISWEGNKINAKFYEIQDIEEGGYEFEVILKEKPNKNVIRFSLEDKGVEYLYQPPLTEEIHIGDSNGRVVSVSETEALDADGKRVFYRPENIVGSYTIVQNRKKHNIKGQKIYRSGQVGIIFRPRIYDSGGRSVWGILDISGNVLSVTIPQSFIDGAVYPIRHAAGLTFGYTSVGGSTEYPSSNVLTGSIFASPSDAGTITDIRLYTRDYGGKKKGVIVLASNMTIISNGVSNEKTCGFYTWNTAVFAVNPSISPSTNYCLMEIDYTSYDIRYTSGSANQGQQDTSNSQASPTNPTDAVGNSRQYSIYVTYETGGSAISAVGDVDWANVSEVGGVAKADIGAVGGVGP